MKKTYINPALVVVEFKVQQLLTGSLLIGTEGDAGEAEGRGFDFDDED